MKCNSPKNFPWRLATFFIVNYSKRQVCLNSLKRKEFSMQSCLVKRAAASVDFARGFDSPVWNGADTQKLGFILPESSSHHPDVRVRILYDDRNIYGFFTVQDRYVRAIRQADQEQVCQDSCVEFFVKPAGSDKYFNFEMNCGGVLLLYHIRSLESQDYIKVPQKDLDTIERYHTLPRIVNPEIATPVGWQLGFRIPIDFFVRYSGISPQLSGQRWRANFTKCADHTSHPHWLSWMPLSKLSFHLPDEFGELIFE